jgi:hypothetical protein
MSLLGFESWAMAQAANNTIVAIALFILRLALKNITQELSKRCGDLKL